MLQQPTTPESQATGRLSIPDHSLLREIGSGSYGEVWLARGMTGVLRAVKVVRRASFRDSRPYERELRGVTAFEPVSRQHDGLVDILQIGSNDAEGYFYYVMEAADNANANGAARLHHTPPDYRPVTLETRLREKGSLPPNECLRIGLVIAQALHFLHQRGLVHRDIKPSNIIFVDGEPKLADVGLVARLENAQTFVGTEGFVPPEGPGTAAADIYSLGKVLYEMVMGKDRQSFPSPPTRLDEMPNRDQVAELNEIINRACAPKPAQRYRSGGELAADLQLLAKGGSVLRSHRRAHWKKVAWYCSAGVAAIAVTLLGAGWLQSQSQRGLRLQREFSLPNGWPAYRALVGDYDGDGQAEMLAADAGRIIALTTDGQFLTEGRVASFRGDSFGVVMLEDTLGTGRKELFTTWRENGTNLLIGVFNQGLQEIKRFQLEGALEQRATGLYPSSTATPAAFLPARSGVPARLLVAVATGYAVWPRYLRCFNYTNQSVAWEISMASTPVYTQPEDLNGDGSKEIICGFHAPANGARLPDGRDDASTHVDVISEEGRLVWSLPTGGKFTRSIPQVACLDGTNYIFALVFRTEEASLMTEKEEPAFGRILKLDAEGRELARYDCPVELSAMLMTPLSPASPLSVLAVDSEGALHVLSTDLELQRKLQVVPKGHDWIALRLHGAADMDKDGRTELLLEAAEVEFVSGTSAGHPEAETNFRTYHQHRILILDEALRPLAQRVVAKSSKHLNSKAVLLPPDAKGRRDVLLLGQTAQLFRFRR